MVYVIHPSIKAVKWGALTYVQIRNRMLGNMINNSYYKASVKKYNELHDLDQKGLLNRDQSERLRAVESLTWTSEHEKIQRESNEFGGFIVMCLLPTVAWGWTGLAWTAGIGGAIALLCLLFPKTMYGDPNKKKPELTPEQHEALWFQQEYVRASRDFPRLNFGSTWQEFKEMYESGSDPRKALRELNKKPRGC